MKKYLLMLAIVLLTGCAHVVASDLRAEADKSISAEELFRHPELHEGKTVILGGVIIGITSTETLSSLEVLEKPLDSRGRPLDTDRSRGRFILEYKGRLDPAIFSPGREITTAAEVVGSELRPLGDADYSYLKLRSRAVYIHRTSARERRVPVHFGLGVFKTF